MTYVSLCSMLLFCTILWCLSNDTQYSIMESWRATILNLFLVYLLIWTASIEFPNAFQTTGDLFLYSFIYIGYSHMYFSLRDSTRMRFIPWAVTCHVKCAENSSEEIEITDFRVYFYLLESLPAIRSYLHCVFLRLLVASVSCIMFCTKGDYLYEEYLWRKKTSDSKHSEQDGSKERASLDCMVAKGQIIVFILEQQKKTFHPICLQRIGIFWILSFSKSIIFLHHFDRIWRWNHFPHY